LRPLTCCVRVTAPHLPCPVCGLVVNGWGVGLSIQKVRLRAVAFSCSMLFAHLCPCHQAVQWGTGHGAACRATGTVTIGLASHHRLQWFIQLQAYGLRKGDEHPASTPHEEWHSLPFLPPFVTMSSQPCTTRGC